MVHVLVSIVREERDVYVAELLDLRNDYVFKAFFGDERNNKLLLQFLKAVLGESIASVRLTDSNVERSHAKDKSPVMDLRVITSSGERINIEMQVQGHLAFAERMLLYWAKMYGGQAKTGELYIELKKAIQIILTDFKLLPKLHYHSMFQLMDPEDGTIFSPHIEIHVLELPKFTATLEENLNDLEKWLFFMKGDKEAKEALSVESSTFKEALSEIERLSQDPATVQMAISREIHLKDQIQREYDAKLLGRKEGAHLRDREIILNMHESNIPAETIAQFTKIPFEKVKSIIKSVTQ